MSLPTDLDALLSRVDALRDEIDAMRPLTAEQAGRATQRLRIEWTYHSNAIEGNSLTYGETRALLMHGVTAHGKPLKDHLDIQRHREVIGYLEDFVTSDEPLTLAVIREMHKLLMGETYEVTAETPDGGRVKRTVEGGAFKTVPNNVKTETGETHYYVSPEEVPSSMADLVDSVRIEDDEHPVVRAARFHHRFVEVHPFPDGNGRTARVLMNLLLMRAGYVPAVIRQEERSTYYGALAEADAGEHTAVVGFIANELAETMDLYVRALRGGPDPTAFSRRISLLRRVSETASPGEVLFDGQRKASLATSFLLPLIHETNRRVMEVKSMFGHVNHVLLVVSGSGATLIREKAKAALVSGDWVSVRTHWELVGLNVRPSFKTSIGYEGRVGSHTFNLDVRKGHVWEFVSGQEVGEAEKDVVLEVAFDSLLSVIEDAVQKAQGT